MTTYTDEISIYNTDAIQGGIDDAHDAYKSVITEVGSTGVKVHPSGQSGSGIVDYTLIDANGTHVYKGGDDVAMFGSTARIGKASGASRMELDSSSLKMVDKNDNVFFKVEDMRGSNGVADITETFLCNESTISSDMIINTEYLPNSANYSVSVLDMSGDDVTGDYTVTIIQQYPNNLSVSPYPPNGHTVVVEYSTESSGAVAYTLGMRAINSLLGSRSVAEGAYVTASAYTSHAEGSRTEAAGSSSHAEGFEAKALGWTSHAQNCSTIAASDHQTAIGKNNVEDALGVYAVIVGNGSSDQYRSNALAVKWNGDVECGDVNGVEISDSGWNTLTLASGWVAYETAQAPKYRKIGPLVELCGAVKPTAATVLNETAVAFGTLPAGYRPNSNRNQLCQASGTRSWLLTVYPNGNAGAARLRAQNSTSYQSAATTEWLTFHIMYFVD